LNVNKTLYYVRKYTVLLVVIKSRFTFCIIHSSSFSFHGIFIMFSGFLSIRNEFRPLRCLQQTNKKEKGFAMEGLEGWYCVLWSELANASILAACSCPSSDCVPISWIPVSLQLNTSFHNLPFPTCALWSAVATNMTLKAEVQNDSQAVRFIQYFRKWEQRRPLFSIIGWCGADLD
jgi:hypothetical protein